jgi:hypothetical protein
MKTFEKNKKGRKANESLQNRKPLWEYQMIPYLVMKNSKKLTIPMTEPLNKFVLCLWK